MWTRKSPQHPEHSPFDANLMNFTCRHIPPTALGAVLLSSLLGTSAAQARTIHQTVDTLPPSGMFEAFDASLGSLEQVVFTYDIRFDSVWSPVSGCQSQGGWHDCTVSWDFDLHGAQEFEGFSDGLGDIFSIDGFSQSETRSFRGEVSFDNLNRFLGNPGDRVGGVFGTLAQGNIGYIEYPVINGESVLRELTWFVQNTLSYDYQPPDSPTPPDTKSVPEPSLLLGVLTLGLAAMGGKCRKGVRS